MKQEDKLRQTLREYYDNQEVPYSDDEWRRAGAYLSKVRRGRRLRNAAFILMPLIFALGAAFLYLPASSGLANKKQGTERSNKGSMAGAKLLTVSSEPVASLTAGTTRRLTAHKENKQPTQAISALPETSEHPAREKFAASRVSGAMRPAPDKDSGAGNAIRPAVLADRVSATPPIAVVDDERDDNSKQDKVRSGSPVDEKKNTEPDPVKKEDAVIDPDQTIPQQPAAPVTVLPQITEPVILNDRKERTAAATDTVKIATLPLLPLTVKADTVLSVSGTIAAPDTLLPLAAQLAGEGIFYEAGAAWLYGWKIAEHRDARGFSPVIGINYMNSLSRRYAFSFGLRYLMVPNLSNSSKTSRVSSYTYGEQSSVTVITPATLHYLVAPLRFHYYMSARNSFGLGVNLAYLLNVDATVTSYDERPGYTGNYKTIKQGGYMQGFSWFDSQLAVSYSRRLLGALALQAEVFIGLTDVKQDAFFGVKGKERNSGLKLSLIYYAFKKNGRK